MFGLFDWLKMGAAGVAAGVVVYGAMALYDATIDDPSVRRQEREVVLAEARARALALIEKRNEDDAEISDLDQSTLCAELGGRWVPDESRCD